MLFHSEAGSFYKTSNHLQGWNLYFCLILNMPTNFHYKFTQSVNSLSTSINAENTFCRHFSPPRGSQCPAKDVSSLQTCSPDPYDHFEPLCRVLAARILHFSILFLKTTKLKFHVFLSFAVFLWGNNGIVLSYWMPISQPCASSTDAAAAAPQLQLLVILTKENLPVSSNLVMLYNIQNNH